MVREKKSKKSLKQVLQLNHALYIVLVLYINYRRREYVVLKIYPFFLLKVNHLQLREGCPPRNLRRLGGQEINHQLYLTFENMVYLNIN